MNNLLKFIKILCVRPALYIGSDKDIKLIRIHLSGYEQALLETGNLEERHSLANFTTYLRLEAKSDDWWDKILINMYGSEEGAIKNLPGKYNQFINVNNN